MATFVLNYWLREFPLSLFGNRFEFRCEPTATESLVLQDLPFFKQNISFLLSTLFMGLTKSEFCNQRVDSVTASERKQAQFCLNFPRFTHQDYLMMQMLINIR